jgi:hypothetical protein
MREAKDHAFYSDRKEHAHPTILQLNRDSADAERLVGFNRQPF